MLAETINCFFETLIMVLFYNRVFERRYRGLAPNTGLFVLFMLLDLSRSFLVIKVSLNLSISAVWCLLACFFIYRGGFIKKLIATAVYMALMVAADSSISMIVSNILNDPLNNGYVLTSESRYIFSAFLHPLMFTLSQLAAAVFTKKYKTLPLKYSILLFAAPVICSIACFCAVLLVYQLIPVSSKNTAMFLFIIICLSLFNLVLYDFIDNYSARVRLAETEEIIRVHDENYRMMRENEQELRKLRHNIRDYMDVMTELAESGNVNETRKYYERLKQVSEQITSRVYTEDAEIDSILNAERKKAVSNGIRYTVKTRVDEPVHIDVVDKSTLLCNLINNAVEGCRSLNDSFVAVSIFSDSDNIKFIVENSADTSAADTGSWRTSKPDRTMHGHGMGIIREIAEKYDGAFDIRHEDNIMTAAVIMKNKA